MVSDMVPSFFIFACNVRVKIIYTQKHNYCISKFDKNIYDKLWVLAESMGVMEEILVKIKKGCYYENNDKHALKHAI